MAHSLGYITELDFYACCFNVCLQLRLFQAFFMVVPIFKYFVDIFRNWFALGVRVFNFNIFTIVYLVFIKLDFWMLFLDMPIPLFSPFEFFSAYKTLTLLALSVLLIGIHFLGFAYFHEIVNYYRKNLIKLIKIY